MADWELTTGEALAQLMLWEHNTTTMRARILDLNSDRYTREGDAHLFAMAVRQAIRFAQLVWTTADGQAKTAIGDAMAEFDRVSPQAKDVRDVLDHYDAYLRGVGHAFPAGSPDDHRPDIVIALQRRPATMFFQRSGDNYKLQIMPRPGTVLVLDVVRDTDAVRQLGDSIRDAIDRYTP